MSSVLAGAAAGKRQAEAILRKKNMEHVASCIARLMKGHKYDGYALENRIEYLLLPNSSSFPHEWTEAERFSIIKKAAIKAFGDPAQMIENGMQQYEVVFHNPTTIPINIAPLGLLANGELITEVQPNQLINIPQGYTVGGRRSTIYGIAPQLKRCEDPVKELELDLTPIDHAEWISYCNYKLSLCCNRQVVWSNHRNSMICQGCKEQVTIWLL